MTRWIINSWFAAKLFHMLNTPFLEKAASLADWENTQRVRNELTDGTAQHTRIDIANKTSLTNVNKFEQHSVKSTAFGAKLPEVMLNAWLCDPFHRKNDAVTWKLAFHSKLSDSETKKENGSNSTGQVLDRGPYHWSICITCYKYRRDRRFPISSSCRLSRPRKYSEIYIVANLVATFQGHVTRTQFSGFSSRHRQTPVTLSLGYRRSHLDCAWVNYLQCERIKITWSHNKYARIYHIFQCGNSAMWKLLKRLLQISLPWEMKILLIFLVDSKLRRVYMSDEWYNSYTILLNTSMMHNKCFNVSIALMSQQT